MSNQSPKVWLYMGRFISQLGDEYAILDGPKIEAGGNKFELIEKSAYDKLEFQYISLNADIDLRVASLSKELLAANASLSAQVDSLQDELIDLRAKKDPEIIEGLKDLSIAFQKQTIDRIRVSRDELRDQVSELVLKSQEGVTVNDGLHHDLETAKIESDRLKKAIRHLVEPLWFVYEEGKTGVCGWCDCGDSGRKTNPDGHDYDCMVSRCHHDVDNVAAWSPLEASLFDQRDEANARIEKLEGDRAFFKEQARVEVALNQESAEREQKLVAALESSNKTILYLMEEYARGNGLDVGRMTVDFNNGLLKAHRGERVK